MRLLFCSFWFIHSVLVVSASFHGPAQASLSRVGPGSLSRVPTQSPGPGLRAGVPARRGRPCPPLSGILREGESERERWGGGVGWGDPRDIPVTRAEFAAAVSQRMAMLLLAPPPPPLLPPPPAAALMMMINTL